jgi:hypothetical protein
MQGLNTSVVWVRLSQPPPCFMRGIATTDPSHGVPADWRGPIRVARYSYDALENLVCMEQHGKDFLIVNGGISLIVDSSPST